MIRVILPPQLQTLAQTDYEVTLSVDEPVSLQAVIDSLEDRYPMLCGTLRDPATRQRRPRIRFFACQEDLSHAPPGERLPEAVVSGSEPLFVVGAISGG